MSDSDLVHKDQYYVAVKLFLERNGSLFIFKDRWGDWDLPGGRIRTYEFETPLEDVIRRKINEEMGGEARYELGSPVVMMRHERVEKLPDNSNPTIRIFAVGYEATLASGEPELGKDHTEMKWVDISTFNPEDYFTGGWLKGVQEYLALKRQP